MRLWKGAESHVSYALQEATDHTTGERLTNSPRQMIKGRISAPLFGSGSSVALEVLGIGSRRGVKGNEVAGATTANLTVIKPLGRSFELLGTMRNLFDVAYASASDQHLQDTIPRNSLSSTSASAGSSRTDVVGELPFVVQSDPYGKAS